MQQEDLTIINFYTLNDQPSKQLVQTLKNSSKFIVGDFNTALSVWLEEPNRR